MKNNVKISSILLLTLASAQLSAATVTIYENDFESGTVASDARFSADDAGGGLRAFNNSLSTIAGGVLSNPGTETNNLGEGAVGLVIGSTLTTENLITISFDYTVGAGSELFFHAQALTVNGTPAANEQLANTASLSGNIQNIAEAEYADFNILTGDDVAANSANSAQTFAGGTSGTFTGTFDLSSYTFSADEEGFAGTALAPADIDLFLFAFAQNVTDTTDAGFTVDNFSVTAVPEPSSLLMSCFGLLGLCLYRKR